MLSIFLDSTDPYFNVAADEYVLKNIEEDCFMLWRNDNAIVVGKFQNMLGEVNHEYVKKHDIKLVRRISGGGAVYHDLGGLNFTFTQSGEDMNLSNFEKFTRPIRAVLKGLGIETELGPTGNLFIDGLKISGNAAHIHKNKILHHGCLLFSSNMEHVRGALKIDPNRYISRAIKSVPKHTTNIVNHLKSPLSLEEFIQRTMDYMPTAFPGTRRYELTRDDIREINQLSQEKYRSWEWTFGRSPDYTFHRKEEISGAVLDNYFVVSKGIIRKAVIGGDFFEKNENEILSQSLMGCRHGEESILQVLGKVSFFPDSVKQTVFLKYCF